MFLLIKKQLFMMNDINFLALFSNKLDNCGLYKLANKIDLVIYKMASLPEQEITKEKE